MHLLAAQAGALQQEGEAIDLGQTPADIIFASAADSELAGFAAAIDRVGAGDVRCANTLKLAHNMSVDLWLEKTVRHTKLVVVRLLGGASYWPYGVDELSASAASNGFKIVFLPGDANPDMTLADRSNISADDWHHLHALFTAGGPDNMDLALSNFRALAQGQPLPQTPPNPFPRFGLWWPSEGIVTPDELEKLAIPSSSLPLGERSREARVRGPFVPILFYRAALEGAGTATLNRLIKTMVRAGLGPVPILVSSLKEAACIRFAQNTFAQFPPEVIFNLTGFALGLDGIDEKLNPFAKTDAPIIQLIQSGRAEAQWREDSQGLTSKDLAMHIVLPELDGRIGALIVGHKEEAVWHEATQCPLSTYAPDADGITHAVELAQNWVRLRQATPKTRKTAIVLANYPIRDGRIANGVGYDAPQSTVEILKAMEGAGYSVTPTPDPSPQGGGEHAHPTSPTLALPIVGRDADRQGGGLPHDGNALIALLQSGPTNANPKRGTSAAILPLDTYNKLFATLPDKIRQEVTERWGAPEADPFCRPSTSPLGGEVGPPASQRASSALTANKAPGEGALSGAAFHLPVLLLGNTAIILQPARGYDRDATANYHDPDLVPPHAYCAAYLWIKHIFGAHALIHNGKHGNLEWLPGKATALDATSYPRALWGALPHFYPFIVNDPGEGTQGKRRTGAVIIDHLVPPLTRSETYGPLKDLEALLDEYYAASGMDRRRRADIAKRILAFTHDAALDRDIALPDDETEALNTIDTYLCDLKEAQIRDGLHIFGQSPTGQLRTDLLVALVRVPRGEAASEASLIRALADDFKLGIDPLTANLGTPWTGPNPAELSASLLPSPSRGLARSPAGKIAPVARFSHSEAMRATLEWQNGGGGATPTVRSLGDVVEHLEQLATQLVTGTPFPPAWQATAAVINTVIQTIAPRLDACGPAEIKALLAGLSGRFIAPGPSGAPTRGRLDVLPTGRNFYSVDIRAVPTQTAWELGRKSAENLITRHFQDHGTWLTSLALSVWGTANMRTGGDDIAQAMALIGAKPKWDPSSLRIAGYEIVPLAKLGRPRVDVTLRISGFFRDAFPQQIALFDKAIRAIGALDEPEDQNPIAARMRTDALQLMAEGQTEQQAALSAGHRIFGSKPGAYGAGLQGLMDSGAWTGKQDLAEAFLNWGQYAYGANAQGLPERARFAARLSNIDAVLHNQDNREHDLLDSDDYYQFEGGLSVTSEVLTGHKPLAYHSDHSRPERPITRTLEEEISKVMRSRVVNPKWITGVMRHGYKGAFEIIATVDYMFAFAATTGAVKTHHFDLAFEAFILDAKVRDFIETNNSYGFDELKQKFRDAIDRGLWTPKSNSAYAELKETKND